jgi:Tol biopolymer transport system component
VAFGGKTMAVLFDAILNKEPQPITEINPALPPELWTIVAKAMEKERELRYQSAADLKADLKRLRRDSAIRRAPVAEAPAAVMPAPAPSSPSAAAISVPATPMSEPESQAKRKWRQRGERKPWTRLVGVVFVLGIIGINRYFDWKEKQSAPKETSNISLANLEVVALTSTGNAGRPAVSSDGKYIVYLTGSGPTASVWLRQTGSTNSVKIMSAEAGRVPVAATIGRDSTFVDVVVNGGGLWRVPFLGGTPKLIAERLGTSVGWAPDGQHMAFIRAGGPDVGQELVITDPDGGNARVLGSRRGTAEFAQNIPGGTVWAPAWSPNGRRIAALQRLSEDVRDIGVVVFDVDTTEARTVSIRGDVPQGVGWLDNRALVVPQALEQGTPSQLWRIAFPDGERTRLTNDINRYVDVSVSADGDTLVTSRPEARTSVWVGDAKGAGREVVRPTPFLSGALQYAMVGWDGQRLLFTHTMNGHFEIFSTTTDGEATPQAVVAGRDFGAAPDGTIAYRTLTGDQAGLWKISRDTKGPVQLAKGSVSYPMVTRDGKEVIYSSPAGGYQTVWRVSAAGGDASQLVQSVVSITGFSDVSPDGKSIAVVINRNWVICDYPACRERRPLSFAGAFPRWMSDGRGLSYVGTNGNLWLHSLDGSPDRQLTQFTDTRPIVHYAWSADGRLAIARATNSSDIVLFKGLNPAK